MCVERYPTPSAIKASVQVDSRLPPFIQIPPVCVPNHIKSAQSFGMSSQNLTPAAGMTPRHGTASSATHYPSSKTIEARNQHPPDTKDEVRDDHAGDAKIPRSMSSSSSSKRNSHGVASDVPMADTELPALDENMSPGPMPQFAGVLGASTGKLVCIFCCCWEGVVWIFGGIC